MVVDDLVAVDPTAGQLLEAVVVVVDLGGCYLVVADLVGCLATPSNHLQPPT